MSMDFTDADFQHDVIPNTPSAARRVRNLLFFWEGARARTGISRFLTLARARVFGMTSLVVFGSGRLGIHNSMFIRHRQNALENVGWLDANKAILRLHRGQQEPDNLRRHDSVPNVASLTTSTWRRRGIHEQVSCPPAGLLRNVRACFERNCARNRNQEVAAREEGCADRKRESHLGRTSPPTGASLCR